MKRYSALSALLAMVSIASLTPISSTGYAEDANIKATSVLHADGTRTETVTNLEERTMEERLVNAAGKLLSRTVSTLDTTGLPESGVVYSPDNRPLSRFQLVRDTMGQVVEQRDFTVAGEVRQRQIFRRNTQGRVIGIDTYDGRGQLVHTTGSSQTKKKSGRR